MLEPWRIVAEEFILNYHETLKKECFIKHGKRSFLKLDEQIKFTTALDQIIDNKRIPYNRRSSSKTTRIRTVIKEEPRKLAKYIRKKNVTLPLSPKFKNVMREQRLGVFF